MSTIKKERKKEVAQVGGRVISACDPLHLLTHCMWPFDSKLILFQVKFNYVHLLHLVVCVPAVTVKNKRGEEEEEAACSSYSSYSNTCSSSGCSSYNDWPSFS